MKRARRDGHELQLGVICSIRIPMVMALAHGKTLIARKSDLLDEIAARCSTGRFIPFTLAFRT
jgi:hypothetical protein